ncbi:hypothetical protein [Streptomyces violarus]|uniref:hypothetical protein n=1 Tax=Streptomyces violarus TaxID=67380 RepID=UPI0021BE76C5|nr:hypothetical protein [Streptomyces violarus]MCT9142426.1 hypothetical protein [Streptomyces violarus]
MSTKTAPKVELAGPALLAVWVRAGLTLAGGAWVLGLQTAWWQRLLMAAAALGLALLDTSKTVALGEVHDLLAALLDRLGWLRIPLGVVGGAWLIDVLTLPADGRVALAAAVVAVALMERVSTGRAVIVGGAG